MVNGEAVKRYKNVELPNELKEVEMTDFHFNVHMDGKITFEIHYEEGALTSPENPALIERLKKQGFIVAERKAPLLICSPYGRQLK